MAKKRKDPCLSTVEELQQELYAAGQALKDAYTRFNYADDPELIDACIYEINASKSRCNYLLRRIKERSGIPIPHPHAVPVPPREPQTVPCVAASNMKGGGVCQS